MNTTYSEQKPGLFTAIAIMTLMSGIINLFWGFIGSATALGTIIGVVCVPVTILPTILGIFEIIYAANLLSSQPQPIKPSKNIAAFQISMILYGNVFSMIVGILNLIFFNDQVVKEYFTKLNGVRIIPSTTVKSSVLEIQEPQPVITVDEIIPTESTITEEVVENIEEPVKPKRTRKAGTK
ncbi:MAG: hypothetical protein U0Z26_03950 [Anaerolineales bacterium]